MPTDFTSHSAAYALSSFMGAKVVSVGSSIGWGAGQPSQLTVRLVDDPVYGAGFVAPTVGAPATFEAGAMSFAGLVQKWEKQRDVAGNPVYEVVLVDPREVLEGAHVITGGYSGSVSGVKNLFNAYGYWEARAYGSSGSSDAGMTWYKIRDAVTAMCNSGTYAPYGGPLTFRGYSYRIDLSQIPQPPSYYRLGGGSIGLFEAIGQVCEDAGCDFFVELVGSTIVVRVASRAVQPPLGTITHLTENVYSGTMVRSTSGLECRNELTSAFLAGGQVVDLWSTAGATQFWGYDADGNVVVGRAGNIPIKDKTGKVIERVNTEFMSLNATPVADVVGGLIYECSTLEMRLAQGNIESWMAYMNQLRPNVVAFAGLPAAFNNQVAAVGKAVGMKPDVVVDNKANLVNARAADNQTNLMRLYEFVRGYADEYMGRKYLCPLPFVLSKRDDDSGALITSWEITDAAYRPDGAEPLGIAPLNADLIRTQDGRYYPFAVFGNLNGVDLGKVSPNNSFIQNGLLYMQVQVDPSIVSYNGPNALITLPAPVVERAVSMLGDDAAVRVAIQGTQKDANAMKNFVAAPFRANPAVRSPSVSAVPLKSNVLTYGPWYAQGAPGKVRFEQDASLTPWAYGSHAAMALAGNARVVSAVTNMQVSETGSMELVGLPAYGLGATMMDGGPNVTAIDIQVGDGVRTSYRFQTFTPRFGLQSKAAAERFRRMSLSAVDLRRQIRAAARDRQVVAKAQADAARAQRAWNQRMAKAHKKETPYDVLHAVCVPDADTGDVRSFPGLTTMEEALFMCSPSGDSFPSTAMMSLGGLVHPFSTGPSSQNMSRFVSPVTSGDVPTVGTLNPWAGVNDVEVFAYGEEYDGAHAYRREVVGEDARLFGLRGPMVVVGWGFAKDTTHVPGNASGWDADYLKRADKWKSGPVDFLWDERRGVWTCHGTVKGRMAGALAASGSATMTVTPRTGSDYALTVYNHFNSEVPANKAVIANYVPDDNRWYVVAADC